MHRGIKTFVGIFLTVIWLVSCTPAKKSGEAKIAVIAESENQWTGLAISEEGRLFVNFPKWSPGANISVAEIIKGETKAYPSEKINTRIADSSSLHRFSCVQSVFIGPENHLWILDPANPYFKGVEKTGPRLYKVDLENDSITRIFTFDPGVYKENSYFNDVRIDGQSKHAYITDSNDGAIIVLDLASGKARRLLDDHPATSAETNFLVIQEDTLKIEVDSDGIALSNDSKDLYFAALSGHRLYKVPTALLKDTSIKKSEIVKAVQKVADIVATDGILFNDYGTLFLGGLENNSVYTYHPDAGYSRMFSHPEIKWADSFAKDSKSSIYFTTSQIHLPENERGKYKIFKIVYK
ncbi:MAG: hypothetical protein K9G58_01940 [Bacteroidales bacterium]|nr:hypothetical protein [Bacteroidales bacterium]MCF8396896.1 hypothetical protein [Bacteroidales bacterium]